MVIIKNSKDSVIVNRKNIDYIQIINSNTYADVEKRKKFGHRHLKICFNNNNILELLIEKYKDQKPEKIINDLYVKLALSDLDIIEI